MMEIVKQIVTQKGAELAKPLIEKLGFSQDQVNTFLPMAVSALMAKFGADDKDESSSFSLTDLIGGAKGLDLGALASGIDLGDIASKVGIGEDKAKAGLTEIAPNVVEGLKEQGLSSVMGALSGGNLGSALGSLGKLF
ncbi:MAG: DUF937 domain-containing protein [Myxococcota bacterium]